jgi:hypothetical protein
MVSGWMVPWPINVVQVAMRFDDIPLLEPFIDDVLACAPDQHACQGRQNDPTRSISTAGRQARQADEPSHPAHQAKST